MVVVVGVMRMRETEGERREGDNEGMWLSLCYWDE